MMISAKKGTIVTKIHASLGLIVKLMIIAKMNCNGTRITIRRHIWKDCCTFVTSVVNLVTSDDVEKRSTFANEKRCTLLNRSWRRFFAKPQLAVAANRPAKTPLVKDTAAKNTKIAP